MSKNTRRRRPTAPEGTLPRYTPDNGPLTAKQQNAIRRLQQPGRMRVKQSLF